jgi:hypothetical protein
MCESLPAYYDDFKAIRKCPEHVRIYHSNPNYQNEMDEYIAPQPLNPATEPTSKNCAINQTGPVWFLPGTTGGAAERTCTIPAGKAILFPVISSECDYASYPNLKSNLFRPFLGPTYPHCRAAEKTLKSLK